MKKKFKEVSEVLFSVLMSCMLSVSAFAVDVSNWTEYQSAINGTDATINVNADITYGADTLNPIVRDLSIVGDVADRYLSGTDTYAGLTVEKGGNLTLQNINMQNFKSTSYGGAISNTDGTISSITGDFKNNFASSNGGAIYNFKQNDVAIIEDIKGNFSKNSANAGGAIYNINGTINKIAGDFESNSATTNGGAISNFGGSSKIGNIAGDFKGNHTDTNAGAIYNGGTIGNSDGTGGITGDFENNSATNMGGAIVNGNTINKVTGNFTKNSAKNGGAVYNAKTINFVAENNKNIIFSGNYVTDESGNGGAIFNATTGTVGLYASADHSITFTGDTTGLPSTARNVDSIHNINILNINGDGTIIPYTGTVNLYSVSDAATAKGTTNIYGGTVGVTGDFKQNTLDVKSDATLDLAKGQINSVTVNTLNFAAGAKLKLDVGKVSDVDKIDNIKYTSGTGSIAVNSINLMSDINAGSLTWLSTPSEEITDITSSIDIGTSNALYHFSKSSYGILDVTKGAAITLPKIIQNHPDISSYTMTNGNEKMLEDMGELNGSNRNFTINGNGYTLDGDGHEGITATSDNQELTFNNVNMENFQRGDFGGAIYNQNIITNITGNFKNNSSTDSDGGAIANDSGIITNITGNFEGNFANNGGAINNVGTSSNITITASTGDIQFKNNYANDSSGHGGAINSDSRSTVNIIANGGNITFDGNYVTSSGGKGGAIYNSLNSTVGMYANAGHNITFVGGNETGKYDIDGIHNEGTLNINGNFESVDYKGTINLVGVTGENGTINIYDGIVNAKNSFVQGTLNNQGEFNFDATGKTGTVTTLSDNTAESKGTTNIKAGSFTVNGNATQKAITVSQNATLTTKGDVTVATDNGIYNDGTITFTGGANIGKGIIRAVINASISGGGITNFGTGIETQKAYVQTNSAITQAVTIKEHADVIANADMGAEGKDIINYGGLTISADNVKSNIVNGPADSSSVLTLINGTLTHKITGGTNASTIISSGKVIAQNTIQQARLSIDSGATLEIDANNLVDIGYFFNQGTLNLTGGTLQSNLIGTGETNINGGTVNANGNITQKNIDVKSGAELNATGKIEVTTLLTNNGNVSVHGIKGAIQNNAGGSITFNNTTDVVDVNLTNSGTVNFDGPLDVPDFKLELTQNAGTMNFSTTAIESTAAYNGEIYSFKMNGGLVNIADGNVNTLHINQLSLTGNADLAIDADLAAKNMDKISVSNVFDNSGTINISDIKLLSDATEEKLSLDLFADDTTKDALKDKVTGNLSGIKYSPIYKYDALYNSETGTVDFTRKNGGDDFNPAIMAGAVASQVGGYLNQLSSYENAFEHIDTYMLTSKQQKTAKSMLNNMSASADNAVYSQPLADESKGIWVKPYAVFEKVSLQGGPRVNNKMYGAFAGIDFDLIELRNDWNLVYSLYASYDGSHQDYDGVNIYQNGGHLGAAATWYKENFFVGLTANVGASAAEASTMYGTDNMTTLMTGAATKAGYNIELEKPNLVIQPSLMMSYSFVNTFDYTNAAGVKIKSDPLHSIQIAPGVKFIGNLPHEWHPYIAAQMVWNMIDETKFTANNINLPGLSTKRYFQYGVGAQKSWGNSFSGYLQAMMRNEGRTGVAFNAGIRWAFGNN